MENVRCAHCGLPNFASAGECKRCHRPLFVFERAGAESVGGGGPRCGFCNYETFAPFCPRCKAPVGEAAPVFDEFDPSPRGGRPGARALRWLVVLAVLAAAGVAGYAYRYRVWYGAGAEYALAIREAEQFTEPLSIKAKKRITLGQGADGPSLGGPDRADPVYVLRARGFVEFGTPSKEERVEGTYTLPGRPSLVGDDEDAPEPETVELKRTYIRSSVSLTPSGEQVAAGWDETDDGVWVVPIGTREVYGIVRVGEAEQEAGVEKRDVEFSWRWRPNSVGEAFDTDGKIFRTLREDARGSVLRFNWGSAKVYRAVAHLERPAGGDWRVVGIEKSDDIDVENELSAF